MHTFNFKTKTLSTVFDKVKHFYMRGNSSRFVDLEHCFLIQRQGFKQIACKAKHFPTVTHIKFYNDGESGYFLVSGNKLAFTFLDDKTIIVGDAFA